MSALSINLLSKEAPLLLLMEVSWSLQIKPPGTVCEAIPAGPKPTSPQGDEEQLITCLDCAHGQHLGSHIHNPVIGVSWEDLPSCGKLGMVCGAFGLIVNKYCKNLHLLFETPALLTAVVASQVTPLRSTWAQVKSAQFDLAPLCCVILKEMNRLDEGN